MIDAAFYWLGLSVFILAAIYGLSEGGMWLLNKTLRSLGLWSVAWSVMSRMYREKLTADHRLGG